MVKSASSSDGDSAATRKPMSLTSLATSTVAYFSGAEKEPRSSIRVLDLKQTEGTTRIFIVFGLLAAKLNGVLVISQLISSQTAP